MIFKELMKISLISLLGCSSTRAQENQRQGVFKAKLPGHIDLAYKPDENKLALKHVLHVGKPELEVDFDLGAAKSIFQSWDMPLPFDGTETEEEQRIMDHPTSFDFSALHNMINSKDNLVNAMETYENLTIKDRRVILTMAKMAGHAYNILPKKPWEDLNPKWHVNSTFGWNKKSVRGYVFSDKDYKNIIISFKGTTFSFLPGGGDAIAPSDRESDNLMFSCCCGATTGNWRQVCSCNKPDNVCSKDCIHKHAQAKTTYYHGAMLIYQEIREKYPEASIILTGHSLGGALASLVGLATDTPAFAFEAPGDQMYAERLGLLDNMAKKKPFIWHIGHTADPIFMGTCNGKLSLCYLGGYGMDSKCHSSNRCVFDTVKDLGWSESIFHHRINDVISGLFEDWAEGNLDIKAKCFENKGCSDCDDWQFK